MHWTIIAISIGCFDVFDYIHTFYHMTKNSMFAIKEWCVFCRHNKELWTVGIASSIRHRDNPLLVSEIAIEKFIFKSSHPDTLSTHTRSRWITSLNHKITNNTMKNDTIIIPFFCKSYKILNCFWCCFRKKFKSDISKIGRKKNFWIHKKCFSVNLLLYFCKFWFSVDEIFVKIAMYLNFAILKNESNTENKTSK